MYAVYGADLRIINPLHVKI